MKEFRLYEEQKITNNIVVNHEKCLFTVAEVAKFLSISRSSVYNLMEAGKLRYVKLGAARRIPKECCQEMIDNSLIGGWNLENIK